MLPDSGLQRDEDDGLCVDALANVPADERTLGDPTHDSRPNRLALAPVPRSRKVAAQDELCTSDESAVDSEAFDIALVPENEQQPVHTESDDDFNIAALFDGAEALGVQHEEQHAMSDLGGLGLNSPADPDFGVANAAVPSASAAPTFPEAPPSPAFSSRLGLADEARERIADLVAGSDCEAEALEHDQEHDPNAASSSRGPRMPASLRQPTLHPDSFRWGAFRFTFTDKNKRPPHGQWQAKCAYHMLNRKTWCTRSLTAGQTPESSALAVRLLKGWCLDACKCRTKKAHGKLPLRHSDALPDEILDARLAEMPDVPSVVVPDDEQPDESAEDGSEGEGDQPTRDDPPQPPEGHRGKRKREPSKAKSKAKTKAKAKAAAKTASASKAKAKGKSKAKARVAPAVCDDEAASDPPTPSSVSLHFTSDSANQSSLSSSSSSSTSD